MTSGWRIDKGHGIWTATTWDDGLLAGMPDEVLLWLATDCAERAMEISGLEVDVFWEAINESRLNALGLSSEKAMDDYYKSTWGVYTKTHTTRAQSHAMGAAHQTTRLFSGKFVYDAIVDSAISVGFFFLDQDGLSYRETIDREGIWRLSRLRYLALLWNASGLRGLGLLMEESPVIPFEDS